MPHNNSQKIKLLVLMELLRQETDEQHPMLTQEICERLNESGITCERRTLSMDIDVLNEHGFEVMSKKVGHSNAYYIEDRSFCVPELKILIDAVQAATFITPVKSAALIEKLAALGGVHQAEILKSNIVCFNNRKHTNEMIYYNVQALEDAIREKKRASFLYFDLNEKHERLYRKNGERYVVDPIALVYHEDNYYLLTHNTKYADVTIYRVDRMEQVHMESAPVCPEAIVESADVNKYTASVFKMYHGQQRDVILEFDDALIAPVFDHFGEDVIIQRIAENRCSLSATIHDSPTFRAWVAQFEGRMTVTEKQ